MSPDGPEPSDAERGAAAWDDARLAARLLAVDPGGLGGVSLRARAGPSRDVWLAQLRRILPAGTPVIRIPLHAPDERVLGGLDLAATLRAGRPVASRGLLAAADGGFVVLPSAERWTKAEAARIEAALDTGEVAPERDGLDLRQRTRFAAVSIDEGIEPEEAPPAGLADRLALRVDLTEIGNPGSDDAAEDGSVRDAVASARARLAGVAVSDAGIEALSAAALAFGIGSLRAPLFAVRTARAAAAFAGRLEAGTDDLATAARLVLAPRATRWPEAPGESSPAEAEPPPPDREADADDSSNRPEPSLDDVVLAAVAAAIPAGLLARLRLGGAARGGPGMAGSGASRRDRRRGRPAGTLRGEPKRGARLDLVETLRAAAPWQPMRRPPGTVRLVVGRDDLRIVRFKRRRETTTVFVVDASGSAAFHRLAEAKGAVELLLADCYIRRDRVALLAFRGRAAELLLPPTRSLARAKRSLASLPGGGGTPLATAIEAAGDLAASIARAGGTPVLVFLTDGRANVARDGEGGRERAASDATAAARRMRQGGAASLFIDISARSSDAAPALAADMGARYLRLPSADAATLSRVVGREVTAAAAERAPR